MLPGEIADNITGVFAYCYIDQTEGLSFRPFLLAVMREDSIQVLLYSKENGIEQVWVRLTFMTKNDVIFGELLNEPYQDYGCHEGTLIELVETDVGDDKVLVFTGRMVRKE